MHEILGQERSTHRGHGLSGLSESFFDAAVRVVSDVDDRAPLVLPFADPGHVPFDLFRSTWFGGQRTQVLKFTTCRLQQATRCFLLLAYQKAGREGLGPSVGFGSSQGSLRG